MSARFAEISDRLRVELRALNAEKATATAAGDTGAVAALALRIEHLEEAMRNVQEEQRRLATQSIRFAVARDPTGLITEVIATPI